MIISLIGYRATGKSTIGSRLATTLQVPFYDSDHLILKKIRKPISEFFATEGENQFREIESEIACELMKIPVGVISWGGGVILTENNREKIKNSSKTIWLQASSETIHERISHDPQSVQNRPALTQLDRIDEIKNHLSLREPLYQECADHTIQTDEKSVEEITQLLVDTINRQ
ncbi:MAG: shikimate kinase [Planctomycetota bacterium]|nr:shikimate kinase [Planctomycetota bacterium]